MYTDFLGLLMVLQNILNLLGEGVESETLHESVRDNNERPNIYGLTFSALIICSGAMVFFDSCSQISLASDDIRCINSEQRSSQMNVG